MMSKKVSLVLSGGGARGLAHIGVIEELLNRGFEIHSIAGTSMGALVGGVYALGKMDEYKNWMLGLDKRKVFSLVDFTWSSQGLIKGDKVLQKMREFIPDQNIENLSIGYAAISANLLTREEVVFTTGSIFEAIRASIAIPTVLTPVKTPDGLLVDGGVVNNLPINRAKRVEGDLLIAVNVNAHIPVNRLIISKKQKEENESKYQIKVREFYQQLSRILPSTKEEYKEEKLGYFNLMSKTINLMTDHITRLNLLQHQPDILVNISRDICGTYDFYMAEELISTGKDAFAKSFEAWNKTQ
jgi:NTE family protein